MLPEVLDNKDNLSLIKVVFPLNPTMAIVDLFQIGTLWIESVSVNL